MRISASKRNAWKRRQPTRCQMADRWVPKFGTHFSFPVVYKPMPYFLCTLFMIQRPPFFGVICLGYFNVCLFDVYEAINQIRMSIGDLLFLHTQVLDDWWPEVDWFSKTKIVFNTSIFSNFINVALYVRSYGDLRSDISFGFWTALQIYETTLSFLKPFFQGPKPKQGPRQKENWSLVIWQLGCCLLFGLFGLWEKFDEDAARLFFDFYVMIGDSIVMLNQIVFANWLLQKPLRSSLYSIKAKKAKKGCFQTCRRPKALSPFNSQSDSRMSKVIIGST